MADYTAAIGTGTIMIRDTGGNVEFWLTAGNGIAYDYNLKWSGVINGRGVGGEFRYNAGAGWVLVFAEYVGSNQNVSFTKTENSGSSGLGGPATVSAYIGRATVPTPPKNTSVDTIRAQTARVLFNGPDSNGGAAIDHYLVRVGTNNPPNTGAYTDYVNYNGNQAISNLQPGVQYYAMVYAHNSVGYSGYSNVVGFRTLAPFWVKVAGVFKLGSVYVKVGGVWKLGIPWVKVNGVWKKTI